VSEDSGSMGTSSSKSGTVTSGSKCSQVVASPDVCESGGMGSSSSSEDSGSIGMSSTSGEVLSSSVGSSDSGTVGSESGGSDGSNSSDVGSTSGS
jgi:hypothetical protein